MPFSATTHAALALEVERLGDHADGEDFLLFRDARDDRRSAVPVPPPMPAAMKHMCAPFRIFLISSADSLAASADFRIGACAEAGRLADPELDLGRRLGPRQGLRVGVRDDELHALQVGLDHVVDGVAACAADADHDYPGSNFNGHWPSSIRTSPNGPARRRKGTR